MPRRRKQKKTETGSETPVSSVLPEGSASPPRRWETLAIAVCALVFFLQGFLASFQKSLTFDEPIYIASGATFLTRSDFRLTQEAPPLLPELAAALPVLFLRLKIPGDELPAWKQGDHLSYPRYFLAANGAKIRAIAFWARLPILLIGAGLIVAIAFWGRRLYGPQAALGATVAAAFSPNLIAHSQLATTDFGCAAFVFLAMFAFWKCLRSRRTRDWLLCGFVTGLALLTKFTALLLGPTYALVGAVFLLRKKIPLLPLLSGAFLIAFASALVVGAGYNFTFDYTPYVEGIRRISSQSTTNPDYWTYLLGVAGPGAWWYYHVVAFFLKVPVPALLLLVLAAVGLLRDRAHREAALFLLLPAFLVVGASCFDKINIGLRHILPAFPFLYLFIAQAFADARKRSYRAVLGALLLWMAFDAAWIFPHHLSYFNEAAGGPARGPYLLDDSNIDWGQDLPALEKWIRKHPEARPLRLALATNVPPELYGVVGETMSKADVLNPRPGTYAVSAHTVVFFRKGWQRYGTGADWLAKYRPVERVGGSIYIYRFP